MRGDRTCGVVCIDNGLASNFPMTTAPTSASPPLTSSASANPLANAAGAASPS
ncbi:hypothetical protein G3N57_29735, partial [Paraburkholderia sp. Se-20369]|nr:hypothetical protein [Paraburkholderia sp. Se-20369]